jgi:pyruvate formate lyase activating enzyme
MVDPNPNRREFLKATACFGVLALGGRALPSLSWAAPLGAGAQDAAAGPLADLIRAAPTARFWVSTTTAKKIADCRACHPTGELPADLGVEHAEKLVQCQLCAQDCRIEEGERGICRARMNVGGELKTLVYGRPITVHVDPIEKKPFYHFLPGAAAFSMATSGCPLRCKFCQNWEISQARPEDYGSEPVAPRRVAEAAVERQAPVIAFTYNEPTVFTEYLLDIARAGRGRGRRSVLVSCGFMNEAPLAAMCEALDAIKIDLKGYSEEFYHRVCGAELKPVLRSIKQVAASGTHLELVNLVVPTLNDSPQMLAELAKWVVGEVGPDVPVHFTRFHPDYQLRHLPPTPVTTLERAREAAMKAGMHYAFVGNVPGHPGNHTYCPRCGKIVIERHGFFVIDSHIKKHSCAECGARIAGVWS